MDEAKGVSVIAQGILEGMSHQLATPEGARVVSRLEIGGEVIAVEDLIDVWLRIASLDRVTCAHCGAESSRSFGGGYCYRCFTTLARCDLCVVSPDRCHYAKGTCREPGWGEAFCMRPHRVYLANSGGAKVGLTHPDNLPARWLDQGASMAAVIIDAPTRHAAGCAEKVVGRHLRESTDWRALVSGPSQEIDLPALWRQLRTQTAAAFDELAGAFDFRFIEAPELHIFEYTNAGFAPPTQLKLDGGDPVAGRCLGAIGSYLLFDRGVFNVRAHSSYHVRIERIEALPPVAAANQMELF